MNLQPQTTGRLDVTSTLSVAFDRATRMMFKPFNIGRWFAFGLMIFLEMFAGGGGSGGNFGNPFSGRGKGGGGLPTPESAVRAVNEGMQWIGDNLALVLGIAIPSLLILLLLTAVFLWLGSRGQMMFIRAVALNDPSIGENWRATKLIADSLFKFRLVLAVIGMAFGFGMIVAVVAIVWRLFAAGSSEVGDYLLQTLPIVGVWFVFAIVLALIGSMLRNFVAPLMYKFGDDCTDAWKRFLPIAKANVGPIFIFLILRVLIGVGAAIIATIVTLLTCCIGGLPVVHQALMSPFYVFDRAWSLYAIGALGPDYAIMVEPQVAPDSPWQQG